MPTISSWMARGLAASLSLAILWGTAAWAQQAPARLRGTVGTFDGSTLKIRSPSGDTEMDIRITDSVAVFGVVKAELSDIKQGSYIGAFGLPEPDGSQKALAIQIFSESERGTGEGFKLWDLRNKTTMTNATVAEIAKGSNGHNILVKYRDKEKKIVVPTDTPIVTFVEGDKSELKPGAQVTVFGVRKNEGGVLEASRIDVGRDGVVPPM